MIAYLKGILKSKSTEGVVVDVGGVGYQVFVSLNTFYELPPETMAVELHTHTHIKEDQWALFGFLRLEEKQLFQQLIKVNGVGPKTALNLLSGLSPYEITQAIANQDLQTLKKIPGIGQKVAERILLDLKGKIAASAGPARKPVASQTYEEALSALTHLGYTPLQAEKSLEKLNWEKGLPVEEAVRQGLKNLARG